MNNEHLFLTVLEYGKSEIKALANLVFDENEVFYGQPPSHYNITWCAGSRLCLGSVL